MSLTAPLVVVSGTSFTLAVRAEDTLGELDVDYALSSMVAVTASAGMLVEQSRSGAGVSLSLSGVADGTTVELTVADGLLSGTVELTVDVEATGLALTAPLVVVSGTSFTLSVRAENALGELDVDYALSSMAAVTVSVGTLAEQSRSGSLACRTVVERRGRWGDGGADGGWMACCRRNGGVDGGCGGDGA